MQQKLCTEHHSETKAITSPEPWNRRFRRRTASLLLNSVWNIGVVDQTAEDIVERGIVQTPRWIPNPRGAYLADPACRSNSDGSRTLFAEHMVRHGVGRGQIWRADLEPGEDLAGAQFRPYLKSAHHVSYPFPIGEEAGRRLLTAETWEASAVLLWEDVDGPRLLGPILSGYPVVDPTLWHDGERWFMFCCLHDHDPEGDLFVFFASSLTGPWEPHPRNPVRRGRVGTRPAGPLFRARGKLIRPGQDCSAVYGGAVILNEVRSMTTTEFTEVPLRRLDPIQGRCDGGLHTICPAGSATLIDGNSRRMDLQSAAWKLHDHFSSRRRRRVIDVA